MAGLSNGFGPLILDIVVTCALYKEWAASNGGDGGHASIMGVLKGLVPTR